MGGQADESRAMNWAPRPNESRRKDQTKAKDRAQRLRSEPTLSEVQLWKLLRKMKAEGAHFRRQAHVGPYVFDFAFLSRRLLIELDGGVHDEPDVALKDAKKANWAESAGWRVIRFKNSEIWSAPDSVLDRVRLALKAPHPLPLPQGGGEEK